MRLMFKCHIVSNARGISLVYLAVNSEIALETFFASGFKMLDSINLTSANLYFRTFQDIYLISISKIDNSVCH